MPEYASQRNVQILVALLKEFGVRQAVISPGSRNMALVRSLESDPYFTCHSIVDERSAVYFAIGVSTAEQNSPVLLSSTSAQATRNYIPGMTEAYHRGTPLVIVTADYDISMIGQGIMQTLDQMSIPHDAAKSSVRLPLVRTDAEAAYCTRLVNESLLELRHHGSGPVHIDIPIDEHWVGSVDSLPKVPALSRHVPGDELPSLDGKRVLIAVGQHAPFSKAEQAAIDAFADRYDAVIYTNHLSNCHGPRTVQASLLVERMDTTNWAKHQPDVLLTIGGQIGEYGFDQKAKTGRFEHWRVHEDGKVQDTFGKLTRVFEYRERDFFDAYSARREVSGPTAYFQQWAKGNARRNIPADLPLSHAFVGATLAPMLPENAVVHFAILSSLRNWNYFELHPSIEGYSNVSAFGIDGCLSTFIGHSVATDRPAYLVIGDLSFFYDMNAVGIRSVKDNVRVILVNNSGGGEFQLYSHAANQFFGDGADTHIAAAGHNGSARGWVESMGWDYIGVTTKDDLHAHSSRFVGSSEKPILMEVFTTMSDDSDGVQIIREANTLESMQGRIGRRLPPRAKKAIKAMMGRK
ncbi:thiamine pyrophosphate-binding protein [Agromyces allii]|uniref:Thiamine pyrophosphate-binding protein n=1 Tax=Agromyces allii TaxID=393607 RepID=A0ABN2R1U7_9MICO|nr:thiamine pyrophosphate-binding protein [Agromyces allii]